MGSSNYPMDAEYCTGGNVDCAGTPNGNLVIDQCGVCGGNNACLGCTNATSNGTRAPTLAPNFTNVTVNITGTLPNTTAQTNITTPAPTVFVDDPASTMVPSMVLATVVLLLALLF